MSKNQKKDYLTIGEVVEKLKVKYPNLSISKVRYLEEEGLIKPERTSGGYRKFSQKDVQRLELILELQKEHFLPLNVIREKLEAAERGEGITLQTKVVASVEEDVFSPSEEGKLVPLNEIPQEMGISKENAQNLESFGILELKQTEEGKMVDSLDLQIMNIARGLSKFGIEPRHLHMYKHFAEREASFFHQILAPTLKQKSLESHKKTAEDLSELLKLSDDLKRLLLKKTVRSYFQDL